MERHRYGVQVVWTGNDGQGTRTYKGYRRDHVIAAEGKAPIEGSSDPSFRGDRSRYSPEELLVASLSSCHMLWYLHLCSVNHLTVLNYQDSALGEMQEHPNGSGEFVCVLLRRWGGLLGQAPDDLLRHRPQPPGQVRILGVLARLLGVAVGQV